MTALTRAPVSMGKTAGTALAAVLASATSEGQLQNLQVSRIAGMLNLRGCLKKRLEPGAGVEPATY